MSQSIHTIPPLAERLASGRPVLTEEQVTDLAKRILTMTSAPMVQVRVTHTAQVITRIADDQVLSGNDGDTLTIRVLLSFDGHNGPINATAIKTNQLSESALRALVQQCEAMDRGRIHGTETAYPLQNQVPDTFVPVHLWHDATVQAMMATRGTVIPDLLDAVLHEPAQRTRQSERLYAAGFLGLMARSEVYCNRDGIFAYNEETDSELTLTLRSEDGKSSGWSGQAARNWATMNYTEVAQHAVAMAKQSANPVALEPGRRTAILSPTAVVQIMRHMAPQFNEQNTLLGLTGFSRPGGGARLRQRVFDPRITMRSDPADPEGGYCPYFEHGNATPATTWIEQGILKELQNGVQEAMMRGKPYIAPPESIRVSGGTTSIEQMIAQCKEGIYVNRFSGVDLVDSRTGLMTGVTRDGCFLVKDGKISKAVKNFRFLDSPFFFLNNIEALGVPERAAFGYTPPRWIDDTDNWPLPPIIVPPMTVRDFNFNSLSDAI